MEIKQGISRISYLALCAYMFIALLASYDIINTMVTILGTMLLASSAKLLLPILFKRVTKPFLRNMTVLLFVGLIIALYYSLLNLVPEMATVKGYALLFSSSLYLILIPFLVMLGENSTRFSWVILVSQWGGFAVIAIILAFLRQLFSKESSLSLGLNDDLGIPFLYQPGGAAFMLLLLLLLVLFFYRQFSQKPIVLANFSSQTQSIKAIGVDGIWVKASIILSLLTFLSLGLATALLWVLEFLLPFSLPLVLEYLLIVLVSLAITGLLGLVILSSERKEKEWIFSPWYQPLVAGILLLVLAGTRYIYSDKNQLTSKLEALVMMYVLLVILWGTVFIGFQFGAALQRKRLFYQIPDILYGLPWLLLLIGMLLLPLSALGNPLLEIKGLVVP